MGSFITCFAAMFLTVEAALGSRNPDWPGYRGPTGDGISESTNVPLNWSDSNNLAWKVPIPGRGGSSPVVLLDRIWLTTAIVSGGKGAAMYGEDMLTAAHVTLEAVCLNRGSGSLVWRKRIFEVDNPAPVH